MAKIHRNLSNIHKVMMIIRAPGVPYFIVLFSSTCIYFSQEMNIPSIVPAEYLEQPSQLAESGKDSMVHPFKLCLEKLGDMSLGIDSILATTLTNHHYGLITTSICAFNLMLLKLATRKVKTTRRMSVA